MSWSRFVAGFSRHPKRVKSGPTASWLWACSVDHCHEYLTDGFLDAAAVPGLCPAIKGPALASAVKSLLAVHSWEAVDGGYQVHGYLEHNLSRSQQESDRTASRQRYQRWIDQRRSNAVVPNDPNAVATPLQQRSNAALYQSVDLSVKKTEPSKKTRYGLLSPSNGQPIAPDDALWAKLRAKVAPERLDKALPATPE